MLPNRIAFFLILSSLIFVCVSCGTKVPPRPAGVPNPVPCTIVVQDESGTPIEKALVILKPESDDGQWSASGATDTSGKAIMKTTGWYNGAVPGKYKVLISKTEIIMTGKMSDDGTEITESNVLIDPKFGNKATSPFMFEVVAGSNTETFKVTKP